MIDPQPVTLEGHGVRLDWYVSVADVRPGRVHGYIDTALQGLQAGTMLPWVVRELGSGDIVGSTRYHDIVREIDRVEIGYTFYTRRWQHTHVNAASKCLLLTHAFETLGCKIVGFRVDGLNAPSQRAVESLGASKDGTLRHFQPRANGSPRDLVFYSIVRDDWPSVRERLLARVDIAAITFDVQGGGIAFREGGGPHASLHQGAESSNVLG